MLYILIVASLQCLRRCVERKDVGTDRQLTNSTIDNLTKHENRITKLLLDTIKLVTFVGQILFYDKHDSTLNKIMSERQLFVVAFDLNQVAIFSPRSNLPYSKTK